MLRSSRELGALLSLLSAEDMRHDRKLSRVPNPRAAVGGWTMCPWRSCGDEGPATRDRACSALPVGAGLAWRADASRLLAAPSRLRSARGPRSSSLPRARVSRNSS
eukprot:2492889-Prymnesium_polylepis.1